MSEKLEAVEKALAEARERQSKSKTELAEIEAEAAKLREDYKLAVEADESAASLDAMDQELFKLDRGKVRLEIKLQQAGKEIEDLFRQREAAHAEEDLQRFLNDLQLAAEQAAVVDRIVATTKELMTKHLPVLARIRAYTQARGMQPGPFRQATVERVMSAAFAGGSVHRVYEQTYEATLRDNCEKTLKHLGIAPEQIVAEVEDGKQQAEQAGAAD